MLSKYYLLFLVLTTIVAFMEERSIEYTEITQSLPSIYCFSVSPSRTFPIVTHQPLRYPIHVLAYFPKFGCLSRKSINTGRCMEEKRKTHAPKFVPNGESNPEQLRGNHLCPPKLSKTTNLGKWPSLEP